MRVKQDKVNAAYLALQCPFVGLLVFERPDLYSELASGKSFAQEGLCEHWSEDDRVELAHAFAQDFNDLGRAEDVQGNKVCILAVCSVVLLWSRFSYSTAWTRERVGRTPRSKRRMVSSLWQRFVSARRM